MGNELLRLWPLDRTITFLNHGSFGACPSAVLREQTAIRAELERGPVRFLSREIFDRLDGARAAVARFVGADAEDLVFVTNATGGVNAVVRSLRFQAGDEVLTTTHAYRACRNALEYAAERAGVRVVTVELPFPLRSPDEVVSAILAKVTARTRLALIDHVTSPTGIVLPIERLVAELNGRGVDTVVDGAHAPGMVPLELNALGAAYYTGNCHKWMCAPKGSAFLHVRRDRHDGIVPLTISHGASAVVPGRSRFQVMFDWMGTADPTAWLTVPAAIDYVGSLFRGGWPEIMRRNRQLALDARRLICDTLATPVPAPDDMIGSLATIPLSDGATTDLGWRRPDPLQAQLYDEFGIEVPIFSWPAAPRRAVRISCAAYNAMDDYAKLAEALKKTT